METFIIVLIVFFGLSTLSWVWVAFFMRIALKGLKENPGKSQDLPPLKRNIKSGHWVLRIVLLILMIRALYDPIFAQEVIYWGLVYSAYELKNYYVSSFVHMHPIFDESL